jgi:peptidoglycan/xylan/chitin deacetylase (PgdA/CDA1 family)
MKIPDHGRFAYSPIGERQTYNWPGGARLAVYIAINVERFAFAKGIGHLISVENQPPDQRGHAWRDYGNRVGIWRMLDMLDMLDLPACHLINSSIFEYAPSVPKAIMARGDEFVGHGRTNAERQGQMWEDDERRLIEEARDIIAHETGRSPRGWMGPWISESFVTPDLLQEAGYTFIMDWPCDDQPFWMATRNGRIMSVPYSIDLNDATQQIHHHHAPQAYGDMLIDRFDEMKRQSRKQPLVCPIPLHPMLTGQPQRILHLRRALKHMRDNSDGVWFTRPGEIYDHCAALAEGIVP